MFEQANGTNSLDINSSGAEAVHIQQMIILHIILKQLIIWRQAFKELLDYVFHPYYTDENVEKEKGIIAQEIKMYDDDPISKVFLTTMYVQ